MTELQPFDYDVLTPDVRSMVQEHTTEIQRLARRSAEDIVEIGERLMEVKSALIHGEFQGWVRAEFGWSYRAAARFMQVAETFKSANLADLTIAPSALYALASDSVPEHLRDELLTMAQATGQTVTNKAVQERLAAHRSDTEPDEPITTPEPQEAPAPLPVVNNAEMPPRKKKPAKDAEPYVPLPVEYEEREHEDGSVHLYPKLPTTLKQEEVKQKDWTALANRVRGAAYDAQVALGKLQDFDLDELQSVVESQPGMQQGVAVQLKLLRGKMQILLEKWEQVPTESKVVDAQPLLELPPPDDQNLSLN